MRDRRVYPSELGDRTESQTTLKVFTFRPDEDVVVQMNDCIDDSYALQVPAA